MAGKATEQPIHVEHYTAGADLSAKQFYFVKLTAEETVGVCSALTDVPIGVLLNAPASGGIADVCVVGRCKVSSDAALSLGDLIGPSADGQADARTIGTDTTQYVVGRVTKASGGAGQVAEALINCLNPHRAA